MTNKREVLSFLTGEGQNSGDFLQLCGAPAPVTSAANSLSTGNRQETPTMQSRVPMFIISYKTQMALNLSQASHLYVLCLVRWGC